MMVENELEKHEWIKEYTNLYIAKNGGSRETAYREAQNEYAKLQSSYYEFGYVDPEDWLYAI